LCNLLKTEIKAIGDVKYEAFDCDMENYFFNST